jgi:hypothetical protein
MVGRTKLSGGVFLATAGLGLLAACGRDEPYRPSAGHGLSVRLRMAPIPAVPEVGPVDTLRFDIRGRSGELLGHPTLLEVAPGQTSFQLSIPAAAGPDRNLTVMAIGSRTVLSPPGTVPNPGTIDRGILYHARTEPFDIRAGSIATIEIGLNLFVPEILPFEETGEATHTINWTPVPGADRYILRRLTSRIGARDSTIIGTSFTGRVRPMSYQVKAVDFSGLTSPWGDWVVVPALLTPPAAPTGAKAAQHPDDLFVVIVDWTDNSTNETGFRIERRQGSGPWIEIGTTGAGEESFVTDIPCETDYTYRVRAWNSAGFSDYSNETNRVILICVDR